MKRLSKKIADILEKNDVRVVSEFMQCKKHIAELEFYSEEGEDFVFDIWHDGTSKSFIQSMKEYADDFDPDEHAEMWLDYRGKGGCPSSMRALIDDANGIKEKLNSIYAALIV